MQLQFPVCKLKQTTFSKTYITFASQISLKVTQDIPFQKRGAPKLRYTANVLSGVNWAGTMIHVRIMITLDPPFGIYEFSNWISKLTFSLLKNLFDKP